MQTSNSFDLHRFLRDECKMSTMSKPNTPNVSPYRLKSLHVSLTLLGSNTQIPWILRRERGRKPQKRRTQQIFCEGYLCTELFSKRAPKSQTLGNPTNFSRTLRRFRPSASLHVSTLSFRLQRISCLCDISVTSTVVCWVFPVHGCALAPKYTHR